MFTKKHAASGVVRSQLFQKRFHLLEAFVTSKRLEILFWHKINTLCKKAPIHTEHVVKCYTTTDFTFTGLKKPLCLCFICNNYNILYVQWHLSWDLFVVIKIIWCPVVLNVFLQHYTNDSRSERKVPEQSASGWEWLTGQVMLEGFPSALPFSIQKSHPFVPSVHPCFGSCPVSAGSECLTSDEAKIKGRRHILPVDQMRNSFTEAIWNFTDRKLNPGEGIKGGVWNGPNAYGTAGMQRLKVLQVNNSWVNTGYTSRRLLHRCQF